jgi:o-succinylbenzoate---CoA ligase
MSETAGGCVYDGMPLDGVRMRIDAGAARPATSNLGRVVLGGPTLAKGYRNPQSPDPFAEKGWFRTDDAGSIGSNGVLAVHGRLDEGISTGGLTVLPQVVEAVIGAHRGVAACAVFGVPDERLGQRVVAAVVPFSVEQPPSLEELRAHVADSLDATAAPRELHLVDALPLRGIGKVDRRALVERFS